MNSKEAIEILDRALAAVNSNRQGHAILGEAVACLSELAQERESLASSYPRFICEVVNGHSPMERLLGEMEERLNARLDELTARFESLNAKGTCE